VLRALNTLSETFCCTSSDEYFKFISKSTDFF